MPKIRPFAKTFEEICNERARELIARAEKLDTNIFVFWSGGIDSTLALVSLIKNSTAREKERLTVLLSEESITEYPRFYKEHIYGKLMFDASSSFPTFLGGKEILINGEHNDQLFGSDIVAPFIAACGGETIHKKYDSDLVAKFFNASLKDESATKRLMNIFEKLRTAAPIPIETNYQFFWWVNFALKWQTVHMRMPPHVQPRRASLVTKEYLRERYAPFYCTEDFQLWSLTNQDKKIKDTWVSYKWLCKDIIYDYTQDAEYRDNKIKKGSLNQLITQYPRHAFIDSDMNFYKDLDPSEYLQSENDFI
jgi:hypothetical protein